MKDKTAMDLRVSVVGRHVATYSGRTLGSVSLQGEFLVVNKKRARSSLFENCYFSMSDVVAYAEGDGGKDGAAYAKVRRTGVIVEVVGKGIVADGEVRLVDSNDTCHVVRLDGGEASSVSVTEEASVGGAGDASRVGDAHPGRAERRASRGDPEPDAARPDRRARSGPSKAPVPAAVATSRKPRGGPDDF